ncbi:MAG: molecular chaperone TorD family protein [Anaerolineales bacterium]|nr:molecular chaperone TorD family protein [Anaerolineales bacterium]
MSDPLIAALRLLSHFWLEEVRPDDLATITALPELAETLPHVDAAAVTDLAVEYQRLFGFNLPPYESIFVDPAAMLLAPATARVQALYRQAGWTPPAHARVGAPDHVGLELLALAEMQAEAKEELAGFAHRLHTMHLVLWVPALVLTLRRLAPHPFYAILGELTLDLLLTTLPSDSPIDHPDPFPVLPPPPVYKDRLNPDVPVFEENSDFSPPASIELEMGLGLRELVKRLLTPREAGLFVTQADITRISRTLDLPTVRGERSSMLETLFRQAGEYELVPGLLDQLRQLLAESEAAYQNWAEEYPAWTAYSQAWCRRVVATRDLLTVSEEMPRTSEQ